MSSPPSIKKDLTRYQQRMNVGKALIHRAVVYSQGIRQTASYLGVGLTALIQQSQCPVHCKIRLNIDTNETD